MTLMQFFLINLGALATAAGGVFLKRLSAGLDHDARVADLVFYSIKSPNIWFGGICYIFPIFLWTYLLKYMELTKLQPLLSIVYVYTIVLSMVLLGESPSLVRLFGIALIILGVIVVSQT